MKLKQMIVAAAILSCGLAGVRAEEDGKSAVAALQTNAAVTLGNHLVELRVDKDTGYFLDIFNKITGLHHKAEASGSWPFQLRLGAATVTMTANAPHPQKMTHTVTTGRGSKTLEMTYDNLLATNGTPTGVRMRVEVTLKDDADYFLIRAHLANNGKYDITRLESGVGDILADSSPEKETLAAPGWGFGTLWQNPRSKVPGGATIGYPIWGSQGALNAGWLDLYGEARTTIRVGTTRAL